MVRCSVLLNDIDKLNEFVKTMSAIKEDADLGSGNHIIDAHSLIGVFLLDLNKEIILTIHSDDESLLDNFKEWRV